MKHKQYWSSQFAFILSAIGSAIGLGNIWRFPYIMGQNGGAVFLVLYLALIFGICSVPLIGEMLLGKCTQKETVSAFGFINPKLKIFGWLTVLTVLIVSSFYFVVGGWIIYYLLKSFSLNNVADFGVYYKQITENAGISIGLSFAFLISCLFFVTRGVNKGIEMANKVMMPCLAFLLIGLTIFSLNLPNAKLGLDFMFSPDFSKINSSMILAALGQALFTLSIGMGSVLTYGSYMKKRDNVVVSSIAIIVADTIFAVMAGVIIFPAVFSFGLEPTSGPGLIFITLPEVFSRMQHCSFVAVSFFTLLFFAALTSGISMLEVIVATLMENFDISRKKASIVLFILLSCMMIPVALSFGVLKEFTIAGFNLFNLFDFVTSNLCLPLNTIMACLAAATVLKLTNTYLFKSELLNKIFLFLLKYVLPLLLLCLIIKGFRI